MWLRLMILSNKSVSSGWSQFSTRLSSEESNSTTAALSSSEVSQLPPAPLPPSSHDENRLQMTSAGSRSYLLCLSFVFFFFFGAVDNSRCLKMINSAGAARDQSGLRGSEIDCVSCWEVKRKWANKKARSQSLRPATLRSHRSKAVTITGRTAQQGRMQ